jgi:hypothetical protein
MFGIRKKKSSRIRNTVKKKSGEKNYTSRLEAEAARPHQNFYPEPEQQQIDGSTLVQNKETAWEYAGMK